MSKFGNIVTLSFIGLMQIGCIFVTTFSIVSIFDSYYWLFELLTHFKLQYFFLSLVLVGGFTVLKRRIFLVIALFSLLINAVFIVPFYLKPSFKSSENNSREIKLLHSNVLTSNRQFSILIEQIQIEDPDVVLLQEVDSWWISALTPIQSDYEYKIEIPRRDNFGIALYSKIPISNHYIRDWGEAGLPSIEAEMVLDNVSFNFIATHPLPPVSKRNYDARNSQILGVSSRVRELKNAKIVMGDLNTSAWSSDYKTLESDTGLYNAARGFGIFPTWPTRLLPMMIPIDHCLVSNHFTVVEVRQGKDIGSDHLPLIVTLKI